MILAEPSRDPRQELGRLGEGLAEARLRDAGWRVVARRFRLRFGEIDLIAERGDLVIFVEVKTRRGTRCGTPAESVTGRKRLRIARTAQAFLSRTGRLDRRARFDVIEVYTGEGGAARVRHIEDAFRLDREP